MSRPQREPIRVHELMKREIFASRSDACDDHFDKSRPCPHEVHGASDMYMVFDSAQKVETSNVGRGEYRFNFNVQSVTASQKIGVHDTVDTVISAQVMPFYVPLISQLEYQTNDPITDVSLPRLVSNAAPPPAGNLSVPLTQLPYGSRITMEMKEIGIQSISDDGNVRHHFEFTAEEYEGSTNGKDRILLTPLYLSSIYTFTTPIRDIDGLTMIFRDPYRPISFPADVLYYVRASVVVIGVNNFLLFTSTNLMGTAVDHNLGPDDRIYIRGFTGVTGAVPEPAMVGVINTYINREEGHIVGSGGLTASTFRLNPDVDVTVFAPGPAIQSTTRIEIVIAKNRVRIPMRFRRVVDRLTNYITL